MSNIVPERGLIASVCMAVTWEIVTLHVGGWRCSPDIKQATSLKPKSVSAEIFLHPLAHHDPVPSDPVGSPELPGGLIFGQSQTQTWGAQQLLRLLPALLWILQVCHYYKLLSYYCSSLQILRWLRRVRPGQPLQLQHCVSQQLLQRPVHRGLRLQRQLQGESANVITCHVSRVSLWPQVVNHVAACACPAGYSGNAASSCFRL